MAYNAGNKVRIAFDNGDTVSAVITGCVGGDIDTPSTPTYRDNCDRCSSSRLYRHVLNPDTSRIL